MAWMNETFPLGSDDRVLQRTPFGFDASVWEFYAPLLSGAVLVIAPRDVHQDGVRLAEVISQHRITTLQLVPSLLRLLLHQGDPPQYRSLERVFCGGEALPVDLVQLFFDRCDAELHNLYGPTEACIDATWWPCRRGTVDATVPIGRPIANVETYILDEHLQPVPVGVAGELHIGGAGLARGYLNDPARTAARFIPHPVSSAPDARLYKTGDLARYRPDGVIEFLGRLDHQVKVRGFRIELGEIEAVLSQHRGIREAAVIVRDDVADDTPLVAYFIARNEPAPSVTELRRFLQQHLPEFMVPSAFVAMNQWPLSSHGKLDRRALPAPSRARPHVDAIFVSPQTELERKIASVWQEVLRLEKIGTEDNFFDLGGHSLLLIRVASKLEATLGTKLPIVALFQYPTVAALAAHVAGHRSATDDMRHVQERAAKHRQAVAAQRQVTARVVPAP